MSCKIIKLGTFVNWLKKQPEFAHLLHRNVFDSLELPTRWLLLVVLWMILELL